MEKTETETHKTNFCEGTSHLRLNSAGKEKKLGSNPTSRLGLQKTGENPLKVNESDPKGKPREGRPDRAWGEKKLVRRDRCGKICRPWRQKTLERRGEGKRLRNCVATYSLKETKSVASLSASRGGGRSALMNQPGNQDIGEKPTLVAQPRGPRRNLARRGS